MKTKKENQKYRKSLINNFAETNYEEAVEQEAEVQEPEPEIQKPSYEPENPIPEPETKPQFYELPPNIDSHPIFHNNQTSQNYHQQFAMSQDPDFNRKKSDSHILSVWIDNKQYKNDKIYFNDISKLNYYKEKLAKRYLVNMDRTFVNDMAEKQKNEFRRRYNNVLGTTTALEDFKANLLLSLQTEMNHSNHFKHYKVKNDPAKEIIKDDFITEPQYSHNNPIEPIIEAKKNVSVINYKLPHVGCLDINENGIGGEKREEDGTEQMGQNDDADNGFIQSWTPGSYPDVLDENFDAEKILWNRDALECYFPDGLDLQNPGCDLRWWVIIIFLKSFFNDFT